MASSSGSRAAALRLALAQISEAHRESGKPLAVVLAGHNGSGKSTFWLKELAATMQLPLVNADRMMMSILPDPPLPDWARTLRDEDESWMSIAQKGVQAFVAQAMAHGAPFAMETVFSHWRERPDGTVESKVDTIKEMQAAGYFVLLIFVGLSSQQLSVARVSTRVESGGHAVSIDKLMSRFPRTQKAIRAASSVADGVLLTDNSRTEDHAFTVCHVRLADTRVYDVRDLAPRTPREISAWLDVVAPRER